MPHTIYINTTFNEQLFKEVKQALKKVPVKEKEIIFRINSLGGNLYILNKICRFMSYMNKYRGCKIYGQVKHAESAALLLFLNCNIRQVAAGSCGVIHLPIPNTTVAKSVVEKKRKGAIAFIKRKTGMSEKLIISLENLPLGPAEMIQLGIATEKVMVFI